MTGYRRNFIPGGCFFSFHRMVKLGIYPEDWAGDFSASGSGFGERS
jgi:putative transposase